MLKSWLKVCRAAITNDGISIRIYIKVLGVRVAVELGVALACVEVLCLVLGVVMPETVGSSIYLPLHYCAQGVQRATSYDQGQLCQLLANCSPRWQL